MSKLIYPFGRLLGRIQSRFQKARPGSVMILVVVLLVLMALIGTAYISSARTDRYTSQQHIFNTQIDLLVQGVIDMVKSKIAGDTLPVTNSRMQPWLADRLPLPDLTSNPPSPYWNNISAPLTGLTYDSPWVDPADPHPTSYMFQTPAPPLPPLPRQAMPTFVYITNSAGLQGYPGMIINDPVAGRHQFLAASASGDGIADCMLVRLPVGEINGVTYYYGVRIIDNSSAINLNTAWKPYNEPNALLTGNNFFPTNIDLQSLLRPDTTPAQRDIRSLNYYRFNNSTFDPTNPAYWATPISDFSGPRPDFVFLTAYDALWQQLGRRILNPGYCINPSGPPYLPFQALPIGDAAALAYRYVLTNPTASLSTAEQLLYPSLLQGNQLSLVRSTPYTPDTPAVPKQWYWDNLAYEQETNDPNTWRPRRALVTTYNPVAETVSSSKFNVRGSWQAGASYLFGDVVKANGFAYVCQFPHTANPAVNPPGSLGGRPYWVLEPWTDVPTKTSVNTASFEQLYLAYWSVMAQTKPFINTAAPALSQPFGMPPFSTATGTALPVFASSLRSGTTLQPYAQMLMRAALAAVNTIDLRDSDNDVTSRVVRIPGPSATTRYDITVYGTEAQPYLTEVYANTKVAGGYVAIELHNPYPFPITLNNWRLATIDRSVSTGGTTTPNLVLTEIGATTTALWNGFIGTNTNVPVLPPNGYLVLASSDACPGATPGPTATVANKTLIVVPDLLLALNKELVILKPRRFDGALSVSTDPLNPFSEGVMDPTTHVISSVNLPDWVPVDSYDFTGLVYDPVNSSNTTPGEWHYVRPNLADNTANSKAWHFVYPGIYNAGVQPRLTGTHVWSTSSPAADNPDAPNLVSLGAADTDPTEPDGVNPPPYVDRVIQLNNTDFGGPNKLTNAIGGGRTNAFPFGTFARNGDILQVPFIGAYKVTLVDTSSSVPQISVLELNSVSMDSAFADDQDGTDNLAENLGRFCPIDINAGLATANDYVPGIVNGALPAPYNTVVQNPLWRYHWATSIFDYLTVQAPSDDYLPNIDPAAYASGTFNASRDPGFYLPDPVANRRRNILNGYINGISQPAPPDRKAWPDPEGIYGDNYSNNTNGATEQTGTVDGLVNVNTAPKWVLARVPWTGDPATDLAIATAVVNFRDVDDGSGATPPHGHGPFQNLFELNLIPQFRLANGAYVAPNGPNGQHVDDAAGDISPANNSTSYPISPPLNTTSNPPANDQVFNDFESQNLMLTRVSNLLTTRSDTFTVYLIVQGWKNVNTSTPELVVQRRAAFILDRSNLTPTNRSVSITNIPTE